MALPMARPHRSVHSSSTTISSAKHGNRFESERQTLALMDHPNIARVFDADSENGGRPYFAMEDVSGPIIENCDQNRLTNQELLELFLPVCEAVQHAHEKGILHRDTKPSSVLVSVQDGVPVWKTRSVSFP